MLRVDSLRRVVRPRKVPHRRGRRTLWRGVLSVFVFARGTRNRQPPFVDRVAMDARDLVFCRSGEIARFANGCTHPDHLPSKDGRVQSHLVPVSPPHGHPRLRRRSRQTESTFLGISRRALRTHQRVPDHRRTFFVHGRRKERVIRRGLQSRRFCPLLRLCASRSVSGLAILHRARPVHNASRKSKRTRKFRACRLPRRLRRRLPPLARMGEDNSNGIETNSAPALWWSKRPSELTLTRASLPFSRALVSHSPEYLNPLSLSI